MRLDYFLFNRLLCKRQSCVLGVPPPPPQKPPHSRVKTTVVRSVHAACASTGAYAHQVEAMEHNRHHYNNLCSHHTHQYTLCVHRVDGAATRLHTLMSAVVGDGFKPSARIALPTSVRGITPKTDNRQEKCIKDNMCVIRVCAQRCVTRVHAQLHRWAPSAPLVHLPKMKL